MLAKLFSKIMTIVIYTRIIIIVVLITAQTRFTHDSASERPSNETNPRTNPLNLANSMKKTVRIEFASINTAFRLLQLRVRLCPTRCILVEQR